jgi:predicted ABC-type exoprotein transport system permease subunit
MADHAEAEYGTAEGNDYAEHEATYEWFVHFTVIAIIHIINIVLGLATGGVRGHWLLAALIFLVATIAAVQGLLSRSKTSSYVALAFSALIFAYSTTS